VAGVAIAEQLDDLARPFARPPSAVEERDMVAARERVTRGGRPGEAGAAEDQDAQLPRSGAGDLGCGRDARRSAERWQRKRGGMEEVTARRVHRELRDDLADGRALSNTRAGSGTAAEREPEDPLGHAQCQGVAWKAT